MGTDLKVVCPNCGTVITDIEDDEFFCPQCGTKIVRSQVAEQPEETAEPQEVTEPQETEQVQTAAEEPKPEEAPAAAPAMAAAKPAGRKLPVAAIAAVAVIALLAAFLIPNMGKNKTYKLALAQMNEGNYALARETFDSLAGYRKSEDYMVYCEALEDFSQGNLADALVKFEQTKGLADADKYASYISALNILKQGPTAKEELVDVRSKLALAGGLADSKELLAYCDGMLAFLADNRDEALAKLASFTQTPGADPNCLAQASQILAYYAAVDAFEANPAAGGDQLATVLAQNNPLIDAKAGLYKTFADALNLYKEKKFFSAYNMFSQCMSTGNASELAGKCLQARPKTGIIYNRKKSKALTLKIVDTKDGDDMFVKIYNKNDTLMETLYIRDGSTGTAYLPAGTFRIAIAYGDKGEWFGTKEAFGTFGNYQRLLLSGSSEYYVFKKNMIYTLKFQQKNGNVGSRGSSFTDL